ncbi:MAG: hypothetical protein FJ191_09185 [Gammaproteobacteria bacterium]|nr:hypothetical protein [Gammaproteobacteria bacterium]
MKPWERKVAPLGFLLAAVLFVVAALLPLASRRPVHATFLAVAILFGIIGAVAWRKSGSQPPPRND